MALEQPLEPGEPWSWDPSLYSGSAVHYASGRVAYPPQLADELARALPLRGSEVLIDVGCGPGSLTLQLAPHVTQAVGVDADPDMLVEASRLAAQAHVGNVVWRHLRGEDLPADLPRPGVVTFAQSFHWMDRPRVAAAVRAMLLDDGALVHVGGITHEGIDDPDAHEDLPLLPPRPPRRAMRELVRHYLGTQRRAGQGILRSGTPGNEDEVFQAAGFRGPERLEVPGHVVERTAEQVAASVYSLSSAAPHLFGDQLEAFDDELRQLLAGASDDDRFSERMGAITASIWR